VPAPTPRGRARREQLVEATAALVAEHGYHQVGVVDIGAAAGVSGAAIYRHFAGKQDLLVAVIERAVDALMGRAEAIVAAAASPTDAIEGLIHTHVEFAMTETALITVYDQEAHNLEDAARRRLRRQQRAYTEVWIDALAQRSPGTPRDSLAAAVHATFGLINSVADHHRRLERAEGATLLEAMALGSLDAAVQRFAD